MKKHIASLMTLLGRLLPGHRNSGDAAVQVGRAGRDVKVLNVTQHISVPPMERPSPAAPERAEKHATVPEVLRLLAQLDGFGKRGVVLAWMHSNFRQWQVKEIDQSALNRTRAYATKVLENSMEDARVATLARGMHEGRKERGQR